MCETNFCFPASLLHLTKPFKGETGVVRDERTQMDNEWFNTRESVSQNTDQDCNGSLPNSVQI